uniref:Leucine-rich repeat-containing N-terminal plant-type domain-containing protein n=1 Tax=Physcomitrium patens TaxID=3218 RepID=A0A2K1KGF6_PHYPA|nr:hypothetical protein PHYPA_009241 [Physcomitrium patens]
MQSHGILWISKKKVLQLSRLSNLEHICVSSNNLIGALPTWNDAMSKLQDVDFSSNSFYEPCTSNQQCQDHKMQSMT